MLNSYVDTTTGCVLQYLSCKTCTKDVIGIQVVTKGNNSKDVEEKQVYLFDRCYIVGFFPLDILCILHRRDLFSVIFFPESDWTQSEQVKNVHFERRCRWF